MSMVYESRKASMQMSEKKGSDQSLIALSENEEEQIDRIPHPLNDCLRGLLTGICIAVLAFCPRQDTRAIQRTPWRIGFIVGMLVLAGVMSYGLYFIITYSLKFDVPKQNQ